MGSVSPFDIQYDFTGAAHAFDCSNADRTDRRAEMLRAFMAAADGRWDEAADRFVEMSPGGGLSSFNARFHAGLCFLLGDHISSAAEAFEAAEKIQPDDFSLHLYAGIAYHLLGLFGRANAHWWAASRIEANPTINAFMRNFFTVDRHPERLALYPFCRGRGIDVGCGHYKTHPDAVGIDLIPGRQLGKVGCVAGRPSQADIVASGDALSIKSDSLDYVAARHDLEHYLDPVEALLEWHRVLKPGGVLGIILPDERFGGTIQLYPTHKHVFTPSSLKRLLDLIKGFEIVHLADLLYQWSFVCIAQKRPIDAAKGVDHQETKTLFEIDQVRRQARCHRLSGARTMADQCEQYARLLERRPVDGHSTSGAQAPSTRQQSTAGIQAMPDSFALESHHTPPATLHLGLVQGDGYGWGVCSRCLIRELSGMRPVQVLDSASGSYQTPQLQGPLFQALINVDFDPMFPEARGTRNFGYTFFENELTERSAANAGRYDCVLGGSSWCRERMLEKGITNCDVLIQGIDPELFYPIDQAGDPERFVIFSGGKFELRKGQDLVLRAVKIMQDKYPDVWLVNCWYNLWPASTRLMCYSPHIRFEHHDNEGWIATMQRTYARNGLDSRRIITQELVPQAHQRDLYAQTDIGLFPNRCEGGTNLVLMEYMACGKPAIVSNTSGHKDIVHADNALLLNRLAPFNLVDDKDRLIGRWQEPALDEIVTRLEYAYHHRAEIKQVGRRAGLDLKRFTWRHSATRLLEVMER
jgi:glycosyltransferase involved in cell wall biosynthesis/SAM-dependent methyltransferase